jgi:hypothetical protein
MKKNESFFSSIKKKISDEENYQYVIFEIIDDVIDKRKGIDLKYDQLMKKLWISEKPINRKTILAKYLLARVLRESEKIFFEAQCLAKQLCPSCRKNISNYGNYSGKIH